MLPLATQAQFAFKTNNDNTITITGYTGTNVNVVIPSATNGYPVTTIGINAFSNNTSVTSVTIPSTVTNIGDNAFTRSGLTNITIPIGVTSVGEYAFSSCSKLTSATISIGWSAFYYCQNLTSVTIPSSVTNFGQWVFYICTNLHQAYFQGSAPSVNGGLGSADNTVFSGESGTVYYVPGTTGWSTNYGGWPTAQWYQPQPQILGSGYGLGLRSNGFQFTISWATNTSVIVEASTNLQNWTPVITNTLVNGTNAFGDSTWTNYPQRFYRVRSP